jgi:NADH:ubiquinone oxidoreductase subunit 6 (subunit J)
MYDAGILLALLATLIGAAFGVLSGSVAARARALPVTVLGVAATLAAVGADLVAAAALATGLSLGLLFTTGEDPWALAARPRGDRRVVPGAIAAITFAVLYLVVVRGAWPPPPAEEPVALTAMVGARLLTSNVAALAAVVVFVAGAIVGAARIAGREARS